MLLMLHRKRITALGDQLLHQADQFLHHLLSGVMTIDLGLVTILSFPHIVQQQSQDRL
jgi:hypothetical protein